MRTYFLPGLWLLATLLSGCVRTFTGYSTSGERPILLNADTYQLMGTSQDPAYGYTAQKPIHVGGYDTQMQEANIQRYLNALQSPQGGKVTWVYEGACCFYKSTRNRLGEASLEIYALVYEGQTLSPLLLYFDTYNYDRLLAPQGLDFLKTAE